MLYKDYLKTSHWIALKWRIRNQRNRCEACSSKLSLNVHHISYKRLGNELDEDLVLLCEDCHHRVHDKQKALRVTIAVATRFVIEMMRKKQQKITLLPPGNNSVWQSPEDRKKKRKKRRRNKKIWDESLRNYRQRYQ